MDNLLQVFMMKPETALSLGAGMLLTILAIIVFLLIAPLCMIFVKAGRQWWEAIVPIYNIYVLTVILGQPWWILFGFFIPFANWVVGIYINYHLSKRFGYGIPFTLGLVFLPFIFLPILGYGNATYIPAQASTPVQPETPAPAQQQ